MSNSFIIFLVILIIFLIIGICFCNKKTIEKLEIRTRPQNELNCDNNMNTNWEDISTWPISKLPNPKNIINNSKKKAYYKLLRDIDKILRKNKLKYVICAGTLLGSFRHGDIIPYDDDADICIKYEDNKKLMSLKNKFRKKHIDLTEGCMACWSKYYEDCCKYLNDRSKIDNNINSINMEKPCKASKYFATFQRDNIHIDIFHVLPIIDSNERKMYSIYGNNRLISKSQYEKMFNTIDCPFGKLNLSCPSNTKELLCQEYKNLSIPTKEQMENKSMNPSMWLGAEDKVSHIMKGGNNKYSFKNFEN